MKGLRGRLMSVVGVFVFIVAFQVVVAMLTIEVLSAVRAYVAGESLYSKGQKDALLHLRSYVLSHGDEDYRRFLQALAIPEGDGRARHALQQAQPDRDAAREGFLAGQNHPDDIDGMIRLFVLGQRVPFMARAIRTWTEGDRAISELRSLADDAHERIVQGRSDADEVHALAGRMPALNTRLTRLERDFSDELGRASRLVQALLLGTNILMGILLAALGTWHIRGTLRRERQKDAEMAELVRAAQELERRELARRNSELERRACPDALTSLPNREALGRQLEAALDAARGSGASFAVLFLDLDGFKQVNDAHGHLAGDTLLKEVADRLRQAVRRQDAVFRLSGDEFVAVVMGDAAPPAVRALAARILAAVREPYALGAVTARVTASIGVAHYPENGTDARSLLLAADSSMYRAKQAGKDVMISA